MTNKGGKVVDVVDDAMVVGAAVGARDNDVDDDVDEEDVDDDEEGNSPAACKMALSRAS